MWKWLSPGFDKLLHHRVEIGRHWYKLACHRADHLTPAFRQGPVITRTGLLQAHVMKTLIQQILVAVAREVWFDHGLHPVFRHSSQLQLLGI